MASVYGSLPWLWCFVLLCFDCGSCVVAVTYGVIIVVGVKGNRRFIHVSYFLY